MSNNGPRARNVPKVFWVNALILGCSIVFALAVAEYAARHYVDTSGWPPYYVGEYDNRDSENFVADHYTGWRMRSAYSFVWQIGPGSAANTYTSNADGFRSDREFTARAPIVLAGDSFTFGTGVAYKKTYGALVEAGLDSTQVYNFAMPGFGIDQMWMAYRHQASGYAPALLVVAFIDDDFERSLTAYRKFEGFNKPSFVLEDGKLRPRSAQDRPPAVITYLRRNLALASVLSQNMEQLGHSLPVGLWWQLNAALLGQIAAEAREAGTPVLFVRLPSRGQRDFATLTAEMTKMQAHYLDLENTTRDYREEDIFIPGDGHINERGHELVAEAILNWVKTNPGILNR